MKTAVQELIKELEVLENNTISISDKFLIKSIRFKTIAKLEKEKEQIKDAYDMGETGLKVVNDEFIKNAEDCYNQTYNQNK